MNSDAVWVKFGAEDSDIEIPTTEKSSAIPILPGAIELFSINPDSCFLHVIALENGEILYATVGSGS